MGVATEQFRLAQRLTHARQEARKGHYLAGENGWEAAPTPGFPSA